MLSDEFYENGFQIFEGIKYSNLIDVENIEWKYEGGINNDYHPSKNIEEINSILYTIHYQIAIDIIEPKIKQYTIEKRRIWEGVNADATSWHNDLKEGPNSFFLLYHSTMINDGFIFFRNGHKEWKILPKIGMLVAVNCDTKFEHKAEISNRKRIVSSYYFNFQND